MIEQGCVPLLWLASMASDPFTAKAAATVFVALRRVTESDKTRQTLVNLVVATGNHELRANVSAALMFFASTGPQPLRQALVSDGAANALSGMLRLRSSREAAAFVLHALNALVREPADVRSLVPSAHALDAYGQLGASDVTVLIRPPGGGKARQPSVKMSCPALPVIQAASPLLGRVVAAAEPPELPELEGRYQVWEEVMAHIAAPLASAGDTRDCHLELLFELLFISQQYQIPGLLVRYSLELAARLSTANVVAILEQATRSQAQWLAVQAWRYLLVGESREGASLLPSALRHWAWGLSRAPFTATPLARKPPPPSPSTTTHSPRPQPQPPSHAVDRSASIAWRQRQAKGRARPGTRRQCST